jgi:chemotaxis protein CheX
MTDAILLPARLDGDGVRALTPLLLSGIKTGHITLDASAVTHMGALGVQAILAAARDLRATGGQISILSLTDRAADQLALMGLTPIQLSEGVR